MKKLPKALLILNLFHSIQCTDEEIAKLPHFSRNQLVLTMFLGSGAFGEVFEGLAKNIRGHIGGDTKCAVKVSI